MLFHWKPNLIHPGQLIFSFHYSSLSILGTINYYLSTHRSILIIERHNLYSVNFHLIDFIFNKFFTNRRTISKTPDSISHWYLINSLIFWRRKRKKKKKSWIDAGVTDMNSNSSLTGRLDSKLCHDRALAYAHALRMARGHEASRESKESRVIGHVGARRASFSFFRRISIANGYR